jgi:hypothetical protein
MMLSENGILGVEASSRMKTPLQTTEAWEMEQLYRCFSLEFKSDVNWFAFFGDARTEAV